MFYMQMWWVRKNFPLVVCTQMLGTPQTIASIFTTSMTTTIPPSGPRSHFLPLVPVLSSEGYPSPRFFPWSLVLGLHGVGVPQSKVGGTPVLVGEGVPEWGTPSPETEQQREYLLRGMPLTVTQEDLLVLTSVSCMQLWLFCSCVASADVSMDHEPPGETLTI